MKRRHLLAGAALLPVDAAPFAADTAGPNGTDTAWPLYIERRRAFDAIDADFRACAERAAGPGGAWRHALGHACDRALDALREAEVAIHAAPSVTITDVRRKLEAAELHFEPDDNDGVTIRAAIDGILRITGADPLA